MRTQPAAADDTKFPLVIISLKLFLCFSNTAAQLFGWEAMASFILVSVVYAVAIGNPSFGNIAPFAAGLSLVIDIFASAFHCPGAHHCCALLDHHDLPRSQKYCERDFLMLLRSPAPMLAAHVDMQTLTASRLYGISTESLLTYMIADLA